MQADSLLSEPPGKPLRPTGRQLSLGEANESGDGGASPQAWQCRVGSEILDPAGPRPHPQTPISFPHGEGSLGRCLRIGPFAHSSMNIIWRLLCARCSQPTLVWGKAQPLAKDYGGVAGLVGWGSFKAIRGSLLFAPGQHPLLEPESHCAPGCHLVRRSSSGRLSP